ncbi:MAG TPA: NAD(P)H-hydrate dehydratase [Vicinamibacterales bacterium]|jgi:NAD(P)H-hydrate epimerase
MRILNADQMRDADRRTIDEIGIPSIVLMENAGRQVVTTLQATFEDLSERKVAILAGRGNNGGDGFVVARTLMQAGVEVSVFVLGSIGDVHGDARVNLEILGRLSLPVVEIAGEEQWELHASEIAGCDVIVDALFGTGLRTPLVGLMETVVADVNSMPVPVVSIDLPSGISADTHEVIGPCIEAMLTVTLGAPKIPLALPPARGMAGDLVVADIGIPIGVIDALEGPDTRLITRADVSGLVPERSREAHKGDFGHVMIVGGSRGKTGAAHLAAMGALRSGAGLVTVATAASSQPVVAALGAEYMTEALAETPLGTIDVSALDAVLAAGRRVIAVGPGLGTGDAVGQFITGLVERTRAPLVLDADAINACASAPGQLVARDGQVIVITPHPGEMARLLGVTTEDVQAHRLDIARNFATTHGLYVVLKGHRTIIATPKGRVFINPTGNPGMATGGTGDVLTGMVAAWLAQLGDAESACVVAVYLHGLAGDLAADDEGEVSMTAADLVLHIGDAVMALASTKREG